jgi:hypothetical protein
MNAFYMHQVASAFFFKVVKDTNSHNTSFEHISMKSGLALIIPEDELPWNDSSNELVLDIVITIVLAPKDSQGHT